MTIEDFLKNIRGEVGFKLGSPWRYSEKSIGVIVPILKYNGNENGNENVNGNFDNRSYITIEEAKDQGVTFKDTGKINKVIVESNIGRPIFIRSGTALKSGLTQPRAVESSVVIIPQEKNSEDWKEWKEKEWKEKDIPIITRQEISVRCIYASKGIRSNEAFTYGGDVPIEVRRSLLGRKNQGHTWHTVAHSTNRLSRQRSYGLGNINNVNDDNNFNDDLVGAMEDIDRFTGTVNDILKKVPLFEDQVGAVFMDIKDVVGIEMFDHPKSWEAIHKEVEKRLGESVTKEENMFFKPDYEKMKPLIFTFLSNLLDGTKKEEFHGITSTISIKGDGVIGEATTIHGKVIHLVGIKDDNPKNQDKPLYTAERIFNDSARINNINKIGSIGRDIIIGTVK